MNFVDNKLFYVLMLLSFLLPGCQAGLDSVTCGATSTYSPSFSSKQRVDEYTELVSNIRQTVVQDEKGSYYHDLDDGYFNRVFLNINDDTALKNEILNGVGLLSPYLTYSYGSGGHPIVWQDMEHTKYMHQRLSDELGLNLMPFDATINYLESVQELSARSPYRYSTSTHKQIIDYAGLSPDYLITVGGLERYYTNYVNWKRGARYDTVSDYKVFYLEALTRGNSIYFLPKALLENSKGIGLYFQSGCLGFSMEQFKERFGRSDKTYERRYTRVTNMNTDRKYDNLEACIVGLRKLGVAGAVKSQRLE